MRPIHEQVLSPPGESFACLRYCEQAFDFPYHTHPEVEILHIEEGEGLCLIGDALETFQSGDCFLFGSNLPHMFFNSGGFPNGVRSRYIQFTPTCFGSPFFSLPELRDVWRLLKQALGGVRFAPSGVAAIYREIDAVFEATGARKIAEFIALLALLEHFPKEISESEN